MKKIGILILAFSLGKQFYLPAQNPNKLQFINEGNYLSSSASSDFRNFYGDSLRGFEETSIRAELIAKGVFGTEYNAYIKVLKRNYIDTKYGLKAPGVPTENSKPKTIGGNNIVNVAPCVNEDFELTPLGAYTTSNAVTGWTLTSGQMMGNCIEGPWAGNAIEFSVVATPITGFPGIGTIPHSPLGGAKVARLNNTFPNFGKTKISTSFPVTSANTLFQFAFAGIASGINNCCDAAGFYTRLLDCSNNIISCGTFTLGPVCNSTNFTFTTGTSGSWTNWQVKSIDLTPFIGSCVTFECWCNDNSFGAQYAAMAFDAHCGNSVLSGLTSLNTASSTAVNYCPGSGLAQLTAPPGYASYSWTATGTLTPLSSSQATLATITITNPVSGGVYLVNCVNSSVCAVPLSYTLVPTQVAIFGIGSNLTCPSGSIGSATVQATGSGGGYNYVWTNASNSVVSTASVATGLASGTYSIAISAPNNTACGSAVTTVAVQSGTFAPNTLTVPYCGPNAYLSAGGGTNFQWYNGTSIIPSPLGTAAAYTINSPANGSTFRLARNYQGCRDSTIFTLQLTSPATLSTTVSGGGCPGVAGASVVINLVPLPNNLLSNANSYTVLSIGSSTPAYISTSTLSSSALSYTALNLTAGNLYSVVVFDGACFSNTTFIASPIIPVFNISTGPSNATVCSGNSLTAFVNMSAQTPAQYTYSWTPSTFLGANTLQNVLITPTVSPGGSSTIIYTVVVTPTLANCPLSTTYAIHFTNPPVPLITSVPDLCKNSPIYSINAFPPGGTFSPLSLSSGVINASAIATGVYTFTYSVSSATCMASSSSSFAVYPLPTVAVTGNFSVCTGEPATLTASGASTYSWSSSQSGSVIIVSPLQTTIYSVVGTSTAGNCQANKIITVTTIPLPTITVSGNFSICTGYSTALTASGANTFTWSTGANVTTLVFSPTITANYTVTGTDALTGCVNSTTLAMKVSKCTGLAEINSDGAPLIYPNPFSEDITVESNGPVDIIIYNDLGQLVFAKKLLTSGNHINLSALSDGIYYLKCDSGKGISVIKLVKTN